MKIIFGTDGWRGILDEEINFQTVSLVAQAFSDYLFERKISKDLGIAIGYDGRKYSKEFAELFAKISISNNIKTFLSDKVIPTPVLSYFVKENKLDAGVMITASHNPPEYNGIKFKDHYGGPFFTEETIKVEKLIGKNSVKKNKNEPTKYDLLKSYLEHIVAKIDLEEIRKSGIKILVDSMSGAGQEILQDLFTTYKIPAKTIYGKPDQNFSNRLAEPIEKNLEPLKEALKLGDFSLGIATDGDADRLGVMLDNGEWLSAQETILLLADYITNSKKEEGDIVKTSSVTDKLISFFKTEKRNVHDVQVGFKYICEKMITENVSVGFEESGGFGFKENIPERDGIYSALIFCEMLAKSGYKKLSDLLTEKRKIFGNIFYKRIDTKYFKEDRLNKLPEINNRSEIIFEPFKFKNKKAFFSSRGVINGLKIVFEGRSRWLLVRASETEPMFRVYAEGESQDEVEKLIEYGRYLLKETD